MNQTGRINAPSANQKLIFVTHRPQTPSTVQQQAQQVNQQNQQSTVVKLVSNANTQNVQKVVTSQQKLVVVCMANSNTVNTQQQQIISNMRGVDLGQSNQSPISVVQKSTLVPQKQQKIEPLLQQQQMDELSH